MPAAVPHTQFSITAQPGSGTARLIVEGELDRVSGPQLNAVLREHVALYGHVALDLEAVGFVDAGGIAVIWAASRHADRHGCKLEVHLSETVASTFRRVGLDRHLPVVAD